MIRTDVGGAMIGGERQAAPQGRGARGSVRLRRGRVSDVPQPFERRPIGRTTVAVTALGAGGYAIGNLGEVIEDSVAREALDAAYAGGVRYFDTAPEYGYGLSERRVGDALRAHPRDECILSTKSRGHAAAARGGRRTPMTSSSARCPSSRSTIIPMTPPCVPSSIACNGWGSRASTSR